MAEAPGVRRRGRAGAAEANSSERRAAHAEVDDVSVVLDAAARFLEVRQRSVAEVRRRLTSAGYRPALVEEAVGRLIDLRYLDDETFARAWVESRDRAHPRGEFVLRRELALKGVDHELAARILEERRTSVPPASERTDASDESPDEPAARRLLERRARQIGANAEPRVRRQRAYALLARNGFDPDVCRHVAAAWAEPEAADEPDEADEADAGGLDEGG